MCNTQILIDHVSFVDDPNVLEMILDCWVDCQVDAGHDSESIIQTLVYIQGDYDPHRHNRIYSVFQKFVDQLSDD